MKELMTEQELRKLLQREEGQFLEFKSLWDLSGSAPKTVSRQAVRDWIAEYAAAFANAEGGMLVLGVDDEGEPSGHGYPDKAVEDFIAVPQQRLRPPISVRSQRIRLEKHELIVIEVAMHTEAVMVVGNGYPFRVGEHVIREPQDVINERKQSYRRVGFDRRVRPEASLADLDLDLARSVLSRTVLGQRPVEEVLESYGLLLPKAGGSAVTNAALLLFGEPPLVRWHPRAGIRFFRVRGKSRTHGADRNVSQLARVELPLVSAIEEAHKIASSHIRRSEKLHSLFFREMPEYPQFAWQEAIVNAFAHRDYSDQGREIEVWFYEDRLEVFSPGGLVPPITLDQLRRREPVHASRNPLIVRVLVDIGIMREEGEGIPRMFEEMSESLLGPPELSTPAAGFQVGLHNEPVFEAGTPDWVGMVQQMALTTAQKRVLIAHPDGFTNEDYRRLSGVDRDQAYRDIQEMIDQGLVLPAQTTGRGAIYRLLPGLHKTRVWLEARSPKLRDHFRTDTSLTNSQYRAIFGLSRYTAARELRVLTQQGFLQRVGERRGTRYLAGPAIRSDRQE